MSGRVRAFLLRYDRLSILRHFYDLAYMRIRTVSLRIVGGKFQKDAYGKFPWPNRAGFRYLLGKETN